MLDPSTHSRRPCSVFVSLSLFSLIFTVPALAQDAESRGAMEQCTQRTIQRLKDAKAAEDQAGPAVLSQCDKQLRAALASAIQRGEAASCNVDTCMDIARQRVTQEATMAYRQALK